MWLPRVVLASLLWASLAPPEFPVQPAQHWPLAHPLPLAGPHGQDGEGCPRKFKGVIQWDWLSEIRPLPLSDLISDHFLPCDLCPSPNPGPNPGPGRHLLCPEGHRALLSLKLCLWLEGFACLIAHLPGLSFILTPSERPSLTPRLGPVRLDPLLSHTSCMTTPPLIEIAFEVSVSQTINSRGQWPYVLLTVVHPQPLANSNLEAGSWSLKSTVWVSF